ncbi:MAG: hypothetical protein ACFCUQ_00405 [Kiloniellales bacterium]
MTLAKGQGFSLGHYVAIGFQLGLFILLVYQFRLESRAFLHLSILIFVGWSIHYLLPFRFRLPFFVFLSLVGIELVFGFQEEQWSLQGLAQGAWIIAIVLGLIVLCHLPVRFALRVALLVAVGGVLALARADLIPVPWSNAIWPIVASMVMFRMILYLHHLRHESKPASLSQTLAYFFMLPNVCFPLFPVVDFQTFRRTYYNQPDRHEIYQTGIHWLFRGVLHLILYRLIYHNFVIDAADVANSRDAVQYFLWPFLLYLRVSGTFHIITGLLHLFGFNLPETHKLYFLSSSFTDFWRRINIYWKDFIMKVVFYPVFFRIRGHGETAALVIATLCAFFMTWLLHSYQWFWIRGAALVSWNDSLFWGFLGLLVVVNAVYETKKGRRRRLAGEALSLRETATTALRTLGVFLSIALLWSFWSASSVGEWLSIWAVLWQAQELYPEAVAMLLAAALGVAVPAALLARGQADWKFNFVQSAARMTVAATLLLIVSLPAVYEPLGSTARQLMASLRDSELNRRDFAKFEGGYYESLLDVGVFNAELWEVYRTRPEEWGRLRESDLVQETPNLMLFALRPSLEMRHAGALVRTNRWGMRDRDYEKTPPPATFRIALLGASFVFGNGVENDETFGAILEERLNSAVSGSNYARYEVLNFGVGAYSPLQRLVQLESKVLDFSPDLILYVEHADVARTVISTIAEVLQKGINQPYDVRHEILAKAAVRESDIDRTTDPYVLERKLAPYEEGILSVVYQRMADVSLEQGVPVVWAFLPRPEKSDEGSMPELEARLAREAGFAVIDLTGVYEGHDLSSLWVARWDHHPNVLGHQLIADRLYDLLRQTDDHIASTFPR